MKQIGAEIGVNESRVSQLHARAIRRLRDALGEMNPAKVAEMRRQLIAFAVRKPAMVKADAAMTAETVAAMPGVVLPYKRTMAKRLTMAKATLKMPRRQAAFAAAR
jgi:hypothetical protein